MKMNIKKVYIQPHVKTVTVNAARILCYSDPSFGVTEDNPSEEGINVD